MVEHLVLVFMSFVISVVPVINFLQLQQIIKILDKGTDKNKVQK